MTERFVFEGILKNRNEYNGVSAIKSGKFDVVADPILLKFTFDAFNLVTEKTLSIFRFLIHIKRMMIFYFLQFAGV